MFSAYLNSDYRPFQSADSSNIGIEELGVDLEHQLHCRKYEALASRWSAQTFPWLTAL